MCGIFGAITDGGLEKTKIDEIKSILQHRGPDSQGHQAFSANVGKVYDAIHCRLAIIDLNDEAAQPLFSICMRYSIIYNGELYNYKQLRKQLLDCGIQFKTQSDTEVVLNAYLKWGKEALKRFRGMFAFAIYDNLENKLFIARDYYGIKPLFYYSKGETFYFSSELKSLLKTDLIPKKINTEALLSYVNFLWIDVDDSIVQGISKLPPASYIEYKDGKISEAKKYLHIDDFDNLYLETDPDAGLGTVMENSVKAHMVSDVPVSAFLSGGLDSSLLSVLAKKYNENLSTYTIAFEDKDKKVEGGSDDDSYATLLANKFGFKHNRIVINPDIVSYLEQIVYTLDEPIADPAAINSFLICKHAREQGVKVLLSGMGADEIFGGYRRHLATLLALRYNKVPSLIRAGVSSVIDRLPVRIGKQGLKTVRWAKRFDSFTGMPAYETYLRSYSYYNKAELDNIFNADMKSHIDSLYLRHEHLFNEKFPNDPLNQMCWTDVHKFMLGLNLTYTDRSSMANSVEVRVPFIDKEVISAALRTRSSDKIKGQVQKYALKKASEDVLPHDIIYRPKASFGAPLRSWIHSDLRDIVDDMLDDKGDFASLFEMANIKKMVDLDRKGQFDYSYQIYQFLTLKKWMDVYL